MMMTIDRPLELKMTVHVYSQHTMYVSIYYIYISTYSAYVYVHKPTWFTLTVKRRIIFLYSFKFDIKLSPYLKGKYI